MKLMFEGHRGEAVAILQRRLIRAGHKVEVTHVFDEATEAAVMALQAAAGLVVDGVVGTKTFMALSGVKMPYHLTAADLAKSAQLLGVPLATMRAVNEVESHGAGMLPDGRPKILFERHQFWRQLEARGYTQDQLAQLELRKPNLVSEKAGGYAGDEAEYVRLAGARLIHEDAANEATSWGAFQVMGYHWKRLGYASLAEFLESMEEGEAGHLDAFVRYVALDPNLVAALKGRKWAVFAKGYNGPNFAKNLYDAKLARAYVKYSEMEKAAA